MPYAQAACNPAVLRLGTAARHGGLELAVSQHTDFEFTVCDERAIRKRADCGRELIVQFRLMAAYTGELVANDDVSAGTQPDGSPMQHPIFHAEETIVRSDGGCLIGGTPP